MISISNVFCHKRIQFSRRNGKHYVTFRGAMAVRVDELLMKRAKNILYVISKVLKGILQIM